MSAKPLVGDIRIANRKTCLCVGVRLMQRYQWCHLSTSLSGFDTRPYIPTN